MKTLFFRFVLCLIVSCLAYITSNQTVAAPLSTVTVGEPRTVRLIYFLPNDRPYREEIVQRMKHEILNIQTFYLESMQAHGYDMTFNIETDDEGVPVVHRVDGKHPEIFYIDNTSDTVYQEIEQVFDVSKNVYFIVIDYSINTIGRGGVIGVGTNYGKNGGTTLMPATFQLGTTLSPGEFQYRTAAHELGHAFGLQHDFRKGNYIMSYGPRRNRNVGQYGKKTQLSQCNADFLAVHPYFNSDISTESGQPPTIEIISPSTYMYNSESVDIQLKVKDSEGIHQVIFFVIIEKALLGPSGYPEVKSYHKLTGEKEVVIDFNYDGDIPSTNFTVLARTTTHPIQIAAVDIDGNVQYKSFVLSEIPPESLPQTPKMINIDAYNALSGDHQKWGLPTGTKFRLGKGGVGQESNAVAFSPDGQLLAVSSDIGIWLYSAMTYNELGLLSNPWLIDSVAFSPDGKTILSGTGGGYTGVGDGRDINLWSVATHKKITTFRGSNGPVAFSPDGETIASVWNKPIIWNIKTGEKLITLPHLTDIFTRPIAFSPDGTLFASGGRSRGHGGDNAVRLWDVTTWQNVNNLWC